MYCIKAVLQPKCCQKARPLKHHKGATFFNAVQNIWVQYFSPGVLYVRVLLPPPEALAFMVQGCRERCSQVRVGMTGQ